MFDLSVVESALALNCALYIILLKLVFSSRKNIGSLMQTVRHLDETKLNAQQVDDRILKALESQKEFQLKLMAIIEPMGKSINEIKLKDAYRDGVEDGRVREP